MNDKDKHPSQSYHHEEIIYKDPAANNGPIQSAQPEERQNIRWYIEPMTFDTMHEAFEWITSGAYNEIGYLYTGYQTTDDKLAHVLLYELVRIHTLHQRRYQQIFADYDYTDNGLVYKVWITPLAEDTDPMEDSI